MILDLKKDYAYPDYGNAYRLLKRGKQRVQISSSIQTAQKIVSIQLYYLNEQDQVVGNIPTLQLEIQADGIIINGEFQERKGAYQDFAPLLLSDDISSLLPLIGDWSLGTNDEYTKLSDIIAIPK